MKALGVIVNPIAGMGGAVALKGTDSAEILRRARDLGAVASAPTKARRALAQLANLRRDVNIVTCCGSMGEAAAREAGFEPRVLDIGQGGETTGADTRRAAEAMVAEQVDLILFAGGDGTARDLCEAIGSGFPVLGVPAGVKIHSGVYAATPERAGELASRFLRGERFESRQAEVMDIDEDAFRAGSVRAKLHGYLQVPYEPRCLQGRKCGSSSDAVELLGVVKQTVSEMLSDVLYLVGCGTTTQAVLEALGLGGSLLGVDAIKGGSLVGTDLSETEILRLVEPGNTKMILTAIGGQGHVFGRGNLQLSPNVIRGVGRENIVVIATPQKIRSLFRKPLLVDTGDPELDEELTGYMPVITGYRQKSMMRIEC